jgi:lipopolysaccharide export system permease protein
LVIFRYLARQILVTMLAVTFILLLIFMSGRFIRYLAKAAEGSLSPDVLFAIMGYRLPGFLELILPLGLFMGVLLSYGRMYMESEMTVLHACAYSDRRLMVHTLSISMLVAVLVGFLSLYLTPWGMTKVEDIFSEQAKLTEFEMLLPGRFQSLKSGNRVTYTERLSEDKRTMYGVFISEQTDKGLQVLVADRGTQRIDEETGERFLILHDGRRFYGSPGQPNYQVTRFDRYGILIDSGMAEERNDKLDYAPTLQLIQDDSPEAKALLEWRISLPLLVPIVTLFALSFSRVNPRQGRFVHLFPAMMFYVIYLGLLIVVRRRMEDQKLPEGVGLWVVHAFFLGLGILVRYRDKVVRVLQRWLRRSGVEGVPS